MHFQHSDPSSSVNYNPAIKESSMRKCIARHVSAILNIA